LIEKIHKWGKDSIVKIQETAKEIQQQVQKLIAAQNGDSQKVKIVIYLFDVHI
jgi:hypothetical protein